MIKSENYPDPVITFILSSGRYKVTLQPILEGIIANLATNETVKMTQWTGKLWYVDVRNRTMYQKARMDGDIDGKINSHRFGLTLDIKRADICWNMDGGNCFVRGQKWLKYFRENFSDAGFQPESLNSMRSFIHLYGYPKNQE